MPPNEPISDRKAFWMGVALVPAWLVFTPAFFVWDAFLAPFREWAIDIGRAFLTERPWRKSDAE